MEAVEYAETVETEETDDFRSVLRSESISTGLLQSKKMYAPNGIMGHKTNASTEIHTVIHHMSIEKIK